MTKYWILQPEDYWSTCKVRGYIEGHKEHLMYPEEYKWMMEQMRSRLPNYKGEYPVWVWVKKPDLRQTHFEKGERFVRLTVELNDNDVLVSDFEDWHMVLNNGFLSFSEEEDNAYEEGKLAMTKEESWNRIFDLETQGDQDWNGERGVWLQGTTGRIELSSVTKVEHFISKRGAGI